MKNSAIDFLSWTLVIMDELCIIFSSIPLLFILASFYTEYPFQEISFYRILIIVLYCCFHSWLWLSLGLGANYNNNNKKRAVSSYVWSETESSYIIILVYKILGFHARFSIAKNSAISVEVMSSNLATVTSQNNVKC